jgi:hypothetical protein
MKRYLWIVAGPVLGALIAAACTSSEATPVGPTTCLLKSDCDAPLACVLGYCHQECTQTGDCPPKAHCRQLSARGYNACAADEEARCEYNTDCKDLLTCSVDGKCRAPCVGDRDCPLPGQSCDIVRGIGVCVDPIEVTGPAGHVADNDVGGPPPLSVAIGAASPAAGAGGGSSAGAAGAGGGSSGGAGAGGGEGSSSTPVCTGAGTSFAGFRPSNLPSPLAVPTGLTHVDSDGNDIVLDTNTFTVSPGSYSAEWAPQHVLLADGREAAVVFFGSWTLAAGQTLSVSGSDPLIIVANGDIQIDGSIETRSGQDGGWGGGAAGPGQPRRAGICPLDGVPLCGGQPGDAQATELGAGGGGFCGIGGKGSTAADGRSGAAGGSVYGSADLIPLVGGSSGGSTEGSDLFNHGGGALELVSGTSITVGNVGSINMGGGAAYNRGNGGGSGGAILLEAPSITIRGVLAANGGAGEDGGGGIAQSGLAGRNPALDMSDGGGPGSADTLVNGGDGVSTPGTYAGGGGGAGRIRLNTGCGGVLLVTSNAIISPAQSTECFSEGQLQTSL